MAKHRNAPRGLLRDEGGLSTVEYIIILVLLAVLGIAIWTSFGDTGAPMGEGATEGAAPANPPTE